MKNVFFPVTLLYFLSQSAVIAAGYEADYAVGFEARKLLLIDYVADEYIPPGGANTYTDSAIPDPEKYTGPKMLARFYKYGPEDNAGNMRGVFDSQSRERTNANTYFDEGTKYSNFFHFRFVAPAYILHRWPTAPSVVENGDKYLGRFPTDRFVFNRKDNYNAFTGEGTENHINMNRTSAFLYALYAIQSDTEWLNESSRYNEMRQWLLDWSKRIYEVGVGEWDSSTYAAFNTMGWLNIHWVTGPEGPIYARDAEVHAAAKAVLDFYAVSHAIRLSQQMMGGAESRANRTYSRFNDGTAYLNWLWFSTEDSTLPANRLSNAIYAIYAAISDYRPPIIAVKLARGEIGVPSVYHNAKPSYILREPAIGHEVFYRHQDYSLGSVNLRIGGFAASTWQVVPWKLMAYSDGDFPDVIWGNGAYFGKRGNTREPFTQHVQYKNVLIQLNRVPADAQSMVNAIYNLYPTWTNAWRADLQQRWSQIDYGGWTNNTPINQQSGSVNDALTSAVLFPASATKSSGQYARYLKVNNTFVAVMSIRSQLPSDNGSDFTDNATPDNLFGLLLEVGSTTEHQTLENFKSLMEAHLAGGALDLSKRDSANEVTYTTLSGDVIKAQYATSGDWKELDYDWVFGVTQSGGVTTMHQHDWKQVDWPSGTNQGRQPTYSVNGMEMIGENPWGVIDGPHVALKNSVLKMTDGLQTYTVNYSGDVPTFSFGENIDDSPKATITVENGQFIVSFPSKENTPYGLYLSLDFKTWSKFGSTIQGDGSSKSISVGRLSGNPNIYWRVRVEN